MNPHKKIKVLYISYTGMLEPLGRSQVITYLSKLTDDYSFILLSFEKSEHLKDTAATAALKNELEAIGIRWVPCRYHKRPRLLATAWDMLTLAALTLRFSSDRAVRIVHCRSYIPAITGWLTSKITGKPFIFDMRALWIDELITAGRLKNTGMLHKLLRWAERGMLHDAASVVSLTDAAVKHLKLQHPAISPEKFQTITTCVDLQRFQPHEAPATPALCMGAMGTLLSGWFHLEWLYRFFIEIQKKQPGAVLKIVSRDNPETLLARAESLGVPRTSIQITASAPNDVARHLADMDFAVMFFKAETGKLGSAPTRMGELLACGIPVVGNHGVGDMASLIRQYDVGVVVDNGSDEAIQAGAEALLEYLKTPDIKAKCQSAASNYFSADAGTERYRAIYQKAVKKGT